MLLKDFMMLELERHGVNVKIIVDDDQKKVIKVKKTTPDIKFAYGDDIIISVNEIILSRLTQLERNLYIQSELTGLWFDTENDKVVYDLQDVKAYGGFLEKYGYDKYKVIEESIKTLYDVKKQEDAEEKAGK
jgi:hypothetical protein